MNSQERELFSIPAEHSFELQDGRHAKRVGYENYYQKDNSGNVLNVWQKQMVGDSVQNYVITWKLLS